MARPALSYKRIENLLASVRLKADRRFKSSPEAMIANSPEMTTQSGDPLRIICVGDCVAEFDTGFDKE